MLHRLIRTAMIAVVCAACTTTGSAVTTPSNGPAPTESFAAPTSPSPTPRIEPPTPAPTPTSTPKAPPAPWSLVVVGDSIAYNSPKDCPGCTGVAPRYAAAIEQATGHKVVLRNLSEHTGLRIEGLLVELSKDKVRLAALAGADIILVTIAHNNVLCADWATDALTCAGLAAQYRSSYERAFAAIAALRAGRPTVLRTVNRYNDVIEAGTTPAQAAGSKLVLDAWNAMVCSAATASGITCADLYHAFNGADGLTPSGNLLARDFIHPSDLGAERISEVLASLGYAPLWP